MEWKYLRGQHIRVCIIIDLLASSPSKYVDTGQIASIQEFRVDI